MRTELEIVFDVLKTVRAATLNNDEPVSPNLVRNYIRKHRGESIRKHYSNGVTVNDEVIQEKRIKLVKVGPKEFMCEIPRIIRLDNHYGFYLQIDGIDIPIVGSESYTLNQRNRFNKILPQCKTSYDKLFLYAGIYPNELDVNQPNGYLVKLIHDSAYQQELENYNMNPKPAAFIEADLKAVFYDPEDADNYDWENGMFPFPAERMPELSQQIKVQEFGIMERAKKDEVQNARQDEIRYHDNENIDQ